jgi:hypothetical protein
MFEANVGKVNTYLFTDSNKDKICQRINDVVLKYKNGGDPFTNKCINPYTAECGNSNYICIYEHILVYKRTQPYSFSSFFISFFVFFFVFNRCR